MISYLPYELLKTCLVACREGYFEYKWIWSTMMLDYRANTHVFHTVQKHNMALFYPLKCDFKMKIWYLDIVYIRVRPFYTPSINLVVGSVFVFSYKGVTLTQQIGFCHSSCSRKTWFVIQPIRWFSHLNIEIKKWYIVLVYSSRAGVQFL